jgi:hypothetical protein
MYVPTCEMEQQLGLEGFQRCISEDFFQAYLDFQARLAAEYENEVLLPTYPSLHFLLTITSQGLKDLDVHLDSLRILLL